MIVNYVLLLISVVSSLSWLLSLYLSMVRTLE